MMVPQGPSTRWCPTPEQLMILEGMYKGGIRTPNAPQIQHITGLLSRYGKIEGKNVFYWFQNHKARDRLKIRRRIHRHQLLLQHQHYHCLGKSHLFHLKMELNHSLSPQISSHTNNHFHVPQEIYQEPHPPMDLLCKLERREREGMESCGYHPTGEDWVISTKDTCLSRPIKTLDLFPTKSTGLKETCTRLSSSTCPSTSITN